MATRVSLVRSVRHKEERDQIGDMIAPFARDLIALESNCLVRLSEAARDARQMQVALNSIVRAQQLESVASFAISQEFASVLWLQNEQKLAVEFLKELVRQIDSYASPPARVNETRKALMLARLVSSTLVTLGDA
jgi:ataxia telangiectasia mutated family protein